MLDTRGAAAYSAAMAADASDTPPVLEAGPQDRPVEASRSSRLLTLIRGMIALGHALLATLDRPMGDRGRRDTLLRFGTRNLDLIVARILRGIAIAQALEQRILRIARRMDKPREPGLAAVRTSGGRAKKPASWSQEDDDAGLLAELPTVEEIAERVRKQPIASVIEDICRDLCIDASDPLFQDVMDALGLCGTRIVRVLDKVLGRRTMAFIQEMIDEEDMSDLLEEAARMARGPPDGLVTPVV